MRSNNKTKRLTIAIITGILATFAAFSLFNTINQQKDLILGLNSKLQEQSKEISNIKDNKILLSAQNSTQQSGLVNVVAAKTDIKAGTKLNSEMLEVRQADFLKAPDSGFNDSGMLVGKITLSDIKTGDFITKDKIIGIKGVNFNIPAGMRAITIPTQYIQGLASYITVGSRIDIISTSKGNGSKPEIVLQNIRIISLEGVTGSLDGETMSTPSATAVTLEIPAGYASKLVNAMIGGKLQVITRGHKDNKIIRSGDSSGGIGYVSPKISYNQVLPPAPKDIKLFQNKSYGILPEPAMPPVRSSSRKIELIQANVKSEVTFD